LEIESPQISSPSLKNEWVNVNIQIPQDFLHIWLKTLKGLKLALQTDKDFPCIEAMCMEAYNAVPNEVWELLEASKDENQVSG